MDNGIQRVPIIMSAGTGKQKPPALFSEGGDGNPQHSAFIDFSNGSSNEPPIFNALVGNGDGIKPPTPVEVAEIGGNGGGKEPPALLSQPVEASAGLGLTIAFCISCIMNKWA